MGEHGDGESVFIEGLTPSDKTDKTDKSPPPRESWDFSSCPEDELFPCLRYELDRELYILRETPFADSWVAESWGEAELEDWALYGNALQEVFSEEAYPASFPLKAYLSISPADRAGVAREMFFSKELDVIPPALFRHKNEDGWKELLESEGHYLENSYQGLPIASYLLVHINWEETNNELRGLFEGWLEKNRPEGSGRRDGKAPQGRGSSTAGGRNLLKSLSMARLWRHFGDWADAVAFLDMEAFRGEKSPFSSEKRAWDRAAAKVEGAILEALGLPTV